MGEGKVGEGEVGLVLVRLVYFQRRGKSVMGGYHLWLHAESDNTA